MKERDYCNFKCLDRDWTNHLFQLIKAMYISSLLVLQIRNNDPLGTTGAPFCFTKFPLFMCFVLFSSSFFFLKEMLTLFFSF